MSSAAISNPPSQQGSKGAKKKKAKQDTPTKSPSVTVDTEGGGEARAEGATNGAEGAYESPYIKDLNRYLH